MEVIDQISDTIRSDSLNKHEKLAQILKLVVDECHIKNDSYFILGKYSLREFREINDLDVNMDVSEFKKLRLLDFGDFGQYNGQERWIYDMTDQYKDLDPNVDDFSIEIYGMDPKEGYPDGRFSLEFLGDNDGFDIDQFGHKHYSLRTLLQWKLEMNRDVDQEDIVLIKNLLKTEQAFAGGAGGGKAGKNYYKKYIKYKRKYLQLTSRLF